MLGNKKHTEIHTGLMIRTPVHCTKPRTKLPEIVWLIIYIKQDHNMYYKLNNNATNKHINFTHTTIKWQSLKIYAIAPL